jgi:FkbM family methyltransferase
VKFEYRQKTFDIESVSQEDWIYTRIVQTGTFYEIDLLEYISSIKRYFSKKNSIAIDVGANIGNHSLFLRSFLVDHLIAVEPNPKVLPVLSRNLERNINSYSIYDCALGETDSLGSIVLPDGAEKNIGMAKIALDGKDKTIRITTLDAIVAQWKKSNIQNGIISIIKIDVEGMELAVLKGARNTIRKYRPHLFIEAGTPEEYFEVNTYLRSLGYQALGKWAATPVYHFSASKRLNIDLRLAEYSRSLKKTRVILAGKIRNLRLFLQVRSQRVQQGIFVRLKNIYRMMVEKLLRQGTRRRHLYQLVLAGAYIFFNEGWLSFVKKTYCHLKKSLASIDNKLRTLRYSLPRLSGLNKKKREPRIIVSLTSYPSRINAAVIVLGLMLRQTCKPDKVLLYLAKEQFPDGKLPVWLRLHKICGVEIIFCDDLKSHKKYYYAMLKYPEDIVITVDDDLYYERDLIECLYRSYKHHPNSVSACRTHLITFDKEGQINPYLKWKWEYSEIIDQPDIKLFATGAGGILYPPHCMHNELFNVEKIKSLCFMADDMWLKIMQVMNNTPMVLVAKNKDINIIEGTQKTALGLTNVVENRNDDQLKNILRYYNAYFGKDDTLIKRLFEGS